MCYTPDNTEFELTGRGFSKMKIRRGKPFHDAISKKLIHGVGAPTLVRQAL
jgi:hypothetical protein